MPRTSEVTLVFEVVEVFQPVDEIICLIIELLGAVLSALLVRLFDGNLVEAGELEILATIHDGVAFFPMNTT